MWQWPDLKLYPRMFLKGRGNIAKISVRMIVSQLTIRLESAITEQKSEALPTCYFNNNFVGSSGRAALRREQCDVPAVGVAVDVAWQRTQQSLMQQWENCFLRGLFRGNNSRCNSGCFLCGPFPGYIARTSAGTRECAHTYIHMPTKISYFFYLIKFVSQWNEEVQYVFTRARHWTQS
jgi:hypothetical protein